MPSSQRVDGKCRLPFLEVNPWLQPQIISGQVSTLTHNTAEQGLHEFLQKLPKQLLQLRFQQNCGCGPQIKLTSKVISSTFLGICRICVSPSSPAIQIHGLAVNMEPPSFLLGTMRMWYGITV